MVLFRLKYNLMFTGVLYGYGFEANRKAIVHIKNFCRKVYQKRAMITQMQVFLDALKIQTNFRGNLQFFTRLLLIFHVVTLIPRRGVVTLIPRQMDTAI